MDKYAEAVAYLTAHPNEIQDAWTCVCRRDGIDVVHPCHVLFAQSVRPFVCLTQLKSYARNGLLTNLTPFEQQVIDDPMIPLDPQMITIEMLPTFAKYQRELESSCM